MSIEDGKLEVLEQSLLTIGEKLAILDKYRVGYKAAKKFIESHVADPDITNAMIKNYHIYIEAKKEIDKAINTQLED